MSVTRVGAQPALGRLITCSSWSSEMACSLRELGGGEAVWGSPQTPTSRTLPLSSCRPSCPGLEIASASSGSRLWRVQRRPRHLTPWSRARGRGSAEPCWDGLGLGRALAHECGQMLPQRGAHDALGTRDVSVPTHPGGLSFQPSLPRSGRVPRPAPRCPAGPAWWCLPAQGVCLPRLNSQRPRSRSVR